MTMRQKMTERDRESIHSFKLEVKHDGLHLFQLSEYISTLRISL